MSSERMRRVDEAIRQVIGEAVAGELKDPRVGFITVTDVRTSADLSHARVYVSVLGDAASSARPAWTGLQQRARLPAEPHRLRAASQAHADADFAYDDTLDRALRVDALLEEIERP